MKVLIVKMSSLGDIVHTMPALTESHAALPQVTFDWLVDDQFAEILKLPRIDNAISKIISIPVRANKKNIIKGIKILPKIFHMLRNTHYDLVIDAQGLLKSAILSKIVRSDKVSGYHSTNCREPLASKFYDHQVKLAKDLPAIDKINYLFSAALNYRTTLNKNFGLLSDPTPKNYLVLLHGTTWDTKHWPQQYWQSLAKELSPHPIVVTYANQLEQERAINIAAGNPHVTLYPTMSLAKLAALIASAKAIVGVDTGLTYLAAAYQRPVIAIYGPTHNNLIGINSTNIVNLQANYYCSPCFQKNCLEYKYKRSSITEPCMLTIKPAEVVAALSKFI